MTHASHKPVMLGEVLSAVEPRDDGVYIDGTFGAGGYSRAILRAADCRVFAIDRDPATRRFAETLEREFPDRFVWILGNFSDMCALAAMHGIHEADGIVLDLGISSMQVDQPERGFSFRQDGLLDMRMSGEGISAADIVNQASEQELADIFYYYGEEKAARRIAHAIVAARVAAPITRTHQLADIIRQVVPGKGQKTDPATRSFQGLRIHVNQELESLENGLKAAEDLLAPGGRLVVVAFHSLEDRIVKRFTHSRCGKLGEPSRHAPERHVAEAAPRFFLPKPEKRRPTEAEIAANPRARSATLRMMIREAYPVRRFSALLWIPVIAVAVFLLYKVKYEVQSLKAQVAETARELEEEKEALHVIAAEWAYLNRPARLQHLAEKYLAADEVTADRIVEIEAIPFPARSEASAAPPEGFRPASARVSGAQ